MGDEEYAGLHSWRIGVLPISVLSAGPSDPARETRKVAWMRRSALVVLCLLTVSASPAFAAIGDVTEYSTPPSAQPRGITAGPDGNLWYAGQTDVIGQLTPTGTFTQFTGITSNGQPRG